MKPLNTAAVDRYVSVGDLVRLDRTVKSEARAYQLIREGIIPVYRQGKRVFVDLEKWEKFKAAGGRGVAEAQ